MEGAMVPWLLACARPAGAPPAPPPPPSPSGTASSTASTSEPPAILPPSARVVSGDPDRFVGDQAGVVPPFGDDGSVLYVTVAGSDGPAMVAIPGDLGPGDHLLADVWDGVSGYCQTPWSASSSARCGSERVGAYTVAGDVDGDGHLDLWVDDRLFLGPLLGQELDPDADAYARIVPAGQEVVVAADLDADGDGVLDLVAQTRGGLGGTVHYGPFAGDLPSGQTADPATVALLGPAGQTCQGGDRGRWLRDQLGAGRDVIALGSGQAKDACLADSVAWDPFQPRGAALSWTDAVGAAGHDYSILSYDDRGLSDAGDLDGDGHPDLIAVDGGYGTVLPGPLAGLADDSGAFEVRNGWVSESVGDVNGDGAPDLVGLRDDLTWVVLGSPFALPLDVSLGVPLGGQELDRVGETAGDLDGDGLMDLIAFSDQWGTVPAEETAVWIWYGRDLAPALDAARR